MSRSDINTVALAPIPPRLIPITPEAFLQAQVNTYREELRKQQRGILRLKKRIARQHHVELANTQLRKQVRELKILLKVKQEVSDG